ncbi:hypothetical protein SEUBUCD650_0I00110 [Saccharomyces eubayanus]|nr:hypothetical protein SEUBUCD650_0I00110 [Saccharomyces eubayanus]
MVLDYFQRNGGRECDGSENPAEEVIRT